MKKTRKIALVIALMAVLLTTCLGVLAFSASTPSVDIAMTNLSIKQNVELKYAVKVDSLPSGAMVGIDVRKGSPTSAEVYQATFEEIAPINGTDYYIFRVDVLSASEMAVNVYAKPYIKLSNGGKTYGAEKKSSIVEYVYKAEGKLDGGKVLSADIQAMLKSMLGYGAAVQAYNGENPDRLATDTYHLVTVVGGTLSDGHASGLYKSGDSITLTANSVDNMTLKGWSGPQGQSLGKNNSITVSVGSKNETYTATFEADTSVVEYVLNGGALPAGSWTDYTPGTAYALPVPTRSGYVFSGWFTTSDLNIDNIISEIPASATGKYKVYAKWNKVISDLGASAMYNSGWIGNESAETGDYKNGRVVSGDVLIWSQGNSQASQIAANGKIYPNLEGAKCFTINVTMAKTADKPVPIATFRTRRSNDTGESGGRIINPFTLDSGGNILLGGEFSVGKLTEEFRTYRVVVDFSQKLFIYYNESGKATAICYFSLPAADSEMSYETWLSKLNGILWQFYGASTPGGAELKIKNISIHAGNSAEREALGEGGAITPELVEKYQTLVEQQREELKTVKGKWSPYLATSSSNPEVYMFSDYTKNIATLQANKWGTVSVDPRADHPRLLVTKETLPLVKEHLDNMDSNTAFRFMNLLYSEPETMGILPEPTNQGTNTTVDNDNIHNYSAAYLELIQVKALGYLVYGEDLYGYQAILYMKNFLKTLEIVQIASDQTRQYGSVMFTAALVYDWCYDLLNETDKIQFIAGVENCICRGRNQIDVKMEIDFPPHKNGSVVGHLSEYQLLRDYLAFSIAIFGDNDSWWDYTAARMYNDFLVVRNYYFQSGIAHQGTGYAGTRHLSDLYSAWILQTATGNNPYIGLEKTVRSFIGYEYKPGEIFNDGDNTGDYKATKSFKDLALITAYLYGDEAMLAQAEYMGIGSAYGSSATGITSAMYIAICGMADIEASDNRYEGMELIQYNGYPLGQYIIRAAWDDVNSAAVFMRLKERSTANHEHMDSGTFEIYYKGMLTSDGGAYNNYGYDHTKYFHKATISHNGLIIYNSNLSSIEKGWYSGGQEELDGHSNSTFDQWYNESALDTATLTGRAHGYSDAAKTKPLYAYIAGELTEAYASVTVDYVGRRMLTVYTGNPDFPMVFFVYDDVESDSADYEKRFLLQISSPNEPTVSGNTVITENGDGRLVLTSLSDNVRMDKVGGRNEGKYSAKASSNYLINGVQLCPKSDTADDGHWGRIEIVYTAKKKQATFMNVLYVTDAGQTKTAPTVSKISGTGVTGGVFGDVAAIFSTSRMPFAGTLTANVSGSGTMKYYISGLSANKWTVKVNGTSYGTYDVDAESGLLTITAPAGTIELTPDKGVINYDLGGKGSLPANAPLNYTPGTTTALPTPTLSASQSNWQFVGWYTSPDFSESSKVTSVPSSAGLSFNVYAKWKLLYLVNEDYSSTTINTTNSSGATVNGVNYSGANGTSVSFVTSTDSRGNKYITVTNNTSASNIGVFVRAMGNLSDALNTAGETSVSFELKLRAVSGKTVLPLNFRIRDSRSGNNGVSFLSISTGGAVKMNGKSLGTLGTSSFTTFRIVVDFKNGKLIAYNENGTQKAYTTFSVPNNDGTIKSTLDWLNHVTNYYFDGQGFGQSAIDIGGIKIYAGDVFKK